MPGVSTEMKNSLGKTLTTLTKVTVPKLDTAAKKIDDLLGTPSVDAGNLDKLKETLKELAERQKNLAVGGTEDKRYQTLRADINKAQTDATKMLGRLQREYRAFADSLRADPLALYRLLGIDVPNASLPPVVTSQNVQQLSGKTPAQVVALLESTWPGTDWEFFDVPGGSIVGNGVLSFFPRGAVVGGIGHDDALVAPDDRLALEQLERGFAQTDGRRWIVGPGCSIHPQTPPERLVAIRESLLRHAGRTS